MDKNTLGKMRAGSLPAPDRGRAWIVDGTTGVTTNLTVPTVPTGGTYKDHLAFSEGHKGPPYHKGGPFAVVHLRDEKKFQFLSGSMPGKNRLTLDAICVHCATPPGTFSFDVPDIRTTTMAAGATGIARTRPGVPEMGLGQAVVEARQVPQMPLAALARNKNARGLGEEALNLEFGIKPMLKDLKDALHLRAKLAKALKQLHRDNGRFIRRRATISNVSSSSTGTFTAQPAPSAYTRLAGTCTWLSTSEDVFTFSGKFRYYIPDFLVEDPPSGVNRVLAGLDLSPSLVWNLTPWSWLSDWFSNFGDLMTNISASAADNVVMTYGYAMGRRIRTQETFVPWVNAPGYPPGGGTVGIIRENSVKTRVPAYPFAFGPTPPSLSYKQAAILGALGMANLPR